MSVLIALAALQAFAQLREGALTPGPWRYAATLGGSEARFGTSFAVTCERTTRRVRLARLDVAGGNAPLTITTDTLRRTVPAGGWLAASDPLLDSLAHSRGRFVVEGGGGLRLLIPAEPEAARSIEDCRN